MRNSTKTISMQLLRRSGLQTKNRIKSYEKVYSWSLEDPSAERLMTMHALTSDKQSVAKPTERLEHVPPRAGQGIMKSHNGTKRPPKTMLLRTRIVKREIA